MTEHQMRIYSIAMLLFVVTVLAVVALIIFFLASDSNYHNFCRSHGYSKAIIGTFWQPVYCYRLENGTEILVPIEEVE